MIIKKNALCVISKEPIADNGWHDIQTNTSWVSNPYGDSYAIVPNEMIDDIFATCGFCEIELDESGENVVSFTALEIPEIEQEEQEPTTEDVLNALLGVSE